MKSLMNEGHWKVPEVLFPETGVLITDSISHFSHRAYPFFSIFCETRSKRSVEVYKGKHLDPPPRPPPTDRDRR